MTDINAFIILMGLPAGFGIFYLTKGLRRYFEKKRYERMLRKIELDTAAYLKSEQYRRYRIELRRRADARESFCIGLGVYSKCKENKNE